MLPNVMLESAKIPTFSNWLDLMLNYTNNYYEVAIVRIWSWKKLNPLNAYYLNKLIVGNKTDNDLPLQNGLLKVERLFMCV
jgi:hypothetical protein